MECVWHCTCTREPAELEARRVRQRPSPDASQATAWGKFILTSNKYLSYWRFSKPNSVSGVLWNFHSVIILQFFATR